ncbi:MAG: hypothetical protein DWQ19_09545 [Crenarchaeota archaeon]|nr:MAG: hypothetical protein DWQ19_09545 [Thermoproteota archaeon]
MRHDLSSPQIAVQSSHAAIETARFISPHVEHPSVIICALDNEEKLQKHLDKLRAQGVICRPFYESDLGNELTAFSTEPIPENKKHIFRRYQLLKSSNFKQAPGCFCQSPQWPGGLCPECVKGGAA